MPLFIVRHQHAADGCPAQDPLLGASLLNHLSRPNVRKFGLQIHGEAVVQGAHTMYLIVEAAEEARLRDFLQPFQMAGSLDIYPASTCVRTVASGGCAMPVPAAADVPTLDPEEACQQAIDAGIVVHRAHPRNCETSLAALVGGVVMPNARFYMRNNFRMPDLEREARLVSERHRNSWQWWELPTRVEPSARLSLRARATDLAGRTQPDRAAWNRLGY